MPTLICGPGVSQALALAADWPENMAAETVMSAAVAGMGTCSLAIVLGSYLSYFEKGGLSPGSNT